MIERLTRWLEAKTKAPPPVYGWLAQWLCLLMAFLTMFVGHNPSKADVWLVGCIIIGVMRQLEKERRNGA